MLSDTERHSAAGGCTTVVRRASDSVSTSGPGSGNSGNGIGFEMTSGAEALRVRRGRASSRRRKDDRRCTPPAVLWLRVKNGRTLPGYDGRLGPQLYAGGGEATERDARYGALRMCSDQAYGEAREVFSSMK